MFFTSVNFPLQVGQLSSFDLQLLQMLWPLLHIVIGGSKYSMQIGHSSSRSRSFERLSISFIANLKEISEFMTVFVKKTQLLSSFQSWFVFGRSVIRLKAKRLVSK